MKNIFISTLAVLLVASNVTFAFTNLPQNKAVIRALNKQTGKTKDIEIPVGQSQLFENILIQVDACYTRPEDETPENSVFVKVNETNTSFKEELNSVKQGKSIFSGWMFSSSPSLSAMEHPNYDIWILECKNDPNLPKIQLPTETSLENDNENIVEETKK